MCNVILVDKDKNTVVVELNDYTNLDIDFSTVIKHKTVKELNKTISEFVKNNS